MLEKYWIVCLNVNCSVPKTKWSFKLCFNSAPPHKTVLRFVGPTDHIYSCSFVQMLERRLENAFDEAQDKVLETYSKLTVEVRRGLWDLYL